MPPSLPQAGQVVMGAYRVERIVGTGGMATVLAAKHVLDGRDVAIKILDPHLIEERDALERFSREARAMATLSSKHTVRVFDVGALPNGLPFMVMELLIGHDLHQELQKRGPLPLAEACVYMDQTCQAVAEAHAQGIIHRDLKPQNLFLTHVNGQPVIRVLDFGIARTTGKSAVKLETITRLGDVVGTLQYMSPEQIRSSSSVDVRSDVWSLGACFYKLITGWPPFPQAGEAPLMSAILTAPPKAMSAYRKDVPGVLSSVIMRCLRKAPEERFPNANELRRAIEEASNILATDEHDDKTDVMSSRGIAVAVAAAAVSTSAMPKFDPPPEPSPRSGGAFNKTLPMSPALAQRAIEEHRRKLAAQEQQRDSSMMQRDSSMMQRPSTPSAPSSIPTPSQPMPISRPSFPQPPPSMPRPLPPHAASSSLGFVLIVAAVALGVFVAGIVLFVILSRHRI